MLRRLSALALAGALVVAGAAQARPAAVHEAVITITNARVNNVKDVVGVTVKITGFFISGGHWQLLWRKAGTAQKAKNTREVRTGRASTTKKLGPGRWVLTARLVDAGGMPFSPRQYPDAKLSAKRTVTVR
jgi:hypothetical protein